MAYYETLDEQEKSKIHKAFMSSMIDRNYDNLDLFIRSGIDLNFIFNSYTPLIYAVLFNDYNLVEYLLKSGSNVNTICTNENNVRYTPLIVSFIKFENKEYTKVDIIEILLRYGAKYDEEVLDVYEDVPSIKALLIKYNNNSKNVAFAFLNNEEQYKIKILFMSSISERNYSKVEEILNLGIDLDYEIEALSPLMSAVLLNDYYMTEKLLDNGTKVNLCYVDKNFNDITALQIAIVNYNHYQKTDIIELLLKKGAKYHSDDILFINNNINLINLFKKYDNNYTNEFKKPENLDDLISNYANLPAQVLNTMYVPENIKLELIKRGIYKLDEEDYFSKKESNNNLVNSNINNESNDIKKNDVGACYIATAVYGDYNCPEVKVLRSFRDEYLLKRFLGRKFVNVYYKYSPILVNKFKDNWRINKSTKFILDYVISKLGNKH